MGDKRAAFVVAVSPLGLSLIHIYRAGRLVDAQSFEYLEFSRDLFSEELLEALQRDCSQSVCIGEDTVVLAHAYFCLLYTSRCV